MGSYWANRIPLKGVIDEPIAEHYSQKGKNDDDRKGKRLDDRI